MSSIILKDLGLNQNEISVYLLLLREGKQKASELTKRTSLSRGLVYKALQDLEDKQIIIKEDEENAVSEFSAIHPNVLQGLVEQKANTVQNLKQSLVNELGTFTSMYNLANNKPGVEFYEGEEGMQKVYDEIIKSTPPNENIISFVKVLDQQLNSKTSSMLNNYINNRIKKNISVRTMAIRDKFGIALQKKDSTSLRITRLVSANKIPLSLPGGEIFTVNNKLYFMSFENNVRIAVVISSNGMTQLFLTLFESLWDSLEAVT